MLINFLRREFSMAFKIHVAEIWQISKIFCEELDPLPQPWQLSFVQYTAVRPVQNSCEACPNLSHLWDVILSTMLVQYTVFWLDLATYKWNFQSWARDNTAATKWKCFLGLKVVGFCFFTLFVVATPPSHQRP